MKFKLIILTVMTIIPIHSITNAASTCTFTGTSCPTSGGFATNTQFVNGTCNYMSSTTDQPTKSPKACYKTSSGQYIQFEDCTRCTSPKTLKQVPLSYLDDRCSNYSGTVTICCETCSASTCVSDTTYSGIGDGYEVKTIRECSECNGCVGEDLLRCAAGYYGDGYNTCTQCPKSTETNTYGTSSPGSTSITGCYIPDGTAFSNTTGRGKFTANCNYSNIVSSIDPIDPIIPTDPIITVLP